MSSLAKYSLLLLILTMLLPAVCAFTPNTLFTQNRLRRQQLSAPTRTVHQARGFEDVFDEDKDEEDDRKLLYARRSGRRGREEGSYYDENTSSSGSKRYQDNVEFFDLDDDDMFEDDVDRKSNDDLYEETYNGIIPNPLLDAMDPDGVYERLGPELFKDFTFWRDLILFTAFLAFFTRDTHHYGTFDSVVEGMERLPSTFIR